MPGTAEDQQALPTEDLGRESIPSAMWAEKDSRRLLDVTFSATARRRASKIDLCETFQIDAGRFFPIILKSTPHSLQNGSSTKYHGYRRLRKLSGELHSQPTVVPNRSLQYRARFDLRQHRPPASVQPVSPSNWRGSGILGAGHRSWIRRRRGQGQRQTVLTSQILRHPSSWPSRAHLLP